MIYSLGWSVLRQVEVTRERWPGREWRTALPLVTLGQHVLPDQPVMRLLRSKPISQSPYAPYNNAHAYERQSEQPIGEEITAIPAGLSGRVVDVTKRGGIVIESRVAAVLGQLGAGRQVVGVLTLWSGERTSRDVIPPGAILVVPGPLNLGLLNQALVSNIQGIVASSMTLPDLEGFLHVDMLQLLTTPNTEMAQEHLPPLTLLLTEGIGQRPMPEHTLSLLQRYQGSLALLSGVTSTSTKVWPELLIPLPVQEARSWHPEQPVHTLSPGAVVRICGGEYNGEIGVIEILLAYQQHFPCGIRARSICVCLEKSNQRVIAPTALVERIG